MWGCVKVRMCVTVGMCECGNVGMCECGYV